MFPTSILYLPTSIRQLPSSAQEQYKSQSGPIEINYRPPHVPDEDEETLGANMVLVQTMQCGT